MSIDQAAPALPPRRKTSRMKTWARRAGTASRLKASDKLLVAEAAAALLSARLRSGMLSFRTLSRQIDGLAPPGTAPASAPLAPDVAAAVRDVRWAIRLVAPRVPFRAVCLQQAIAARAMLARRGVRSVMHLGVRHPVIDKMEAHAWLEAGEIRVTGYPLDPAMIEVARFI